MKFEPVRRHRSRRAVLVQVVGPAAQAVHLVTRDAQAAYADSIGADYKILRPKEVHSVYSKACAFHYTRYYDQSLILDVDVLPTGLAPNIFDLVPQGSWGVVDDSAMRPRHQWHDHQRDFNHLMDRKGLPTSYMGRVANTGVIVAPHNAEAICYNEDRQPCRNNREEKVWFTYNLERARQKVVWLHDLWNVCQTDTMFNQKYPYANFIHRNEDKYKIHNLSSDVVQHGGSVHIPNFTKGGNAIVTVNFSDDPFYSSTRDSIVKYAEFTGAQLIEITGTYALKMHACWPKYYAGQVAQHFDKTLYLDTDVYIDDLAPNIFEYVPDNQWCFVDESGIVGNQALTAEYDKCLVSHQLVRRGRWQIFNAGIMVIPPHGIEIYHHNKPWQLDQFWDEQTLLNNDIVGHEFHVLDTSWDTMPFTRSNKPVKFYHVAGGGKFNNLAQHLGYEFNRILLWWPEKSVAAERLAKNIDRQLCRDIMLGHYNFDVEDIHLQHKKYTTVVDDPVAFNPHLIYYIDTPIAQQMADRHGIYILTGDDLSSDVKINNARMWGRVTTTIATDPITAQRAIEAGINVYPDMCKYHIPIPAKDGIAYETIDNDCLLIGMIYSPGDDYKAAVSEIMADPKYKVITINDHTKSIRCNYRMNDIRHSGNLLARLNAIVDITGQYPYNPLLLEAVLTRTPVAAYGMNMDVYNTPDTNIISTVNRLCEVSMKTLQHRQQIILEYLDKNECWGIWRKLMESIDVTPSEEFVI